MKRKYLEAGKIVGTHGLKGEVRVDPWCDSASFLTKFKRFFYCDGTELKVISSRAHKNIAIIHLEGVSDVNAADALRDRVLYIDREDARLPKGTYFIQDIIGLKVIDIDSREEYGEVTDVMKTGANDVYQVTKDGTDYLVPAIPDIIIERNIDDGIMKIRPIKGIFHDED